MSAGQPETAGERIVSDPRIPQGKPVVRGTRIPVACLAGMSKDELLEAYPALTEDGVGAALRYAARVLHQARDAR